VFFAFLLFCVLMAIRTAFSMNIQLTGQERLMVIHKVSLINPLPAAYEGRIKQVPGVTEVTHANWFGGYYQDVRNQFATFAVDPEGWLHIYRTEFELPEDQKKAFIADRTGAVVGIDTAKKYGFKIGQKIPIQGTIYRRPDGGPWEFTIDGIYDSKIKGADKTNLLFNYQYLRETIPEASGFRDMYGWYVVAVDNPDRSAEIAAKIDELFANSPYETKTATEKAFVSGWAKQIGDIGQIMMWIVAMAMFTILLVTGNTMAQAIRERTNELAVLKTLGFPDGRILWMVLAESVLIAAVGGGAGLALGYVAISAMGDPTGGLLPAFYFPTPSIVLGIVLVLTLGLAAGFLPAWQAGRLRITDALRRN
jgi:putative ABC transport system permease protein